VEWLVAIMQKRLVRTGNINLLAKRGKHKG